MNKWKSFADYYPTCGVHIVVADIATKEIALTIAENGGKRILAMDLPPDFNPTHWVYVIIPDYSDE